tara:strand:- start:189 stop:383 length:195 start_codon:yes stop_codon:yes gene_type:complete
MIEIKLTKKEFKILRYILVYTGNDAFIAKNLSDYLGEPVTDQDLTNLFGNFNNTKDLREAGLFK